MENLLKHSRFVGKNKSDLLYERLYTLSCLTAD